MSDQIKFPANLLFPVGKYLQIKLASLEKRLKETEAEDPFKDTERLVDNASPDADAAEQFGHARSTAVKTELLKKIIQTKKALSSIKWGNYGICEDCKKMIDTDRLVVYPEATKCVKCEAKREK
jgi:DnaK suppressor protein